MAVLSVAVRSPQREEAAAGQSRAMSRKLSCFVAEEDGDLSSPSPPPEDHQDPLRKLVENSTKVENLLFKNMIHYFFTPTVAE